jgi:hypothetical protein
VAGGRKRTREKRKMKRKKKVKEAFAALPSPYLAIFMCPCV